MRDDLFTLLLIILCFAACDSCAEERANVRQLYCPAPAVSP